MEGERSFDSRVTALETDVKHVATREDLSKLETRLVNKMWLISASNILILGGLMSLFQFMN